MLDVIEDDDMRCGVVLNTLVVVVAVDNSLVVVVSGNVVVVVSGNVVVVVSRNVAVVDHEVENLDVVDVGVKVDVVVGTDEVAEVEVLTLRAL